MTFIQMASAYGKPENATHTDFDYLYVDYDSEFGLVNLSSQDIASLNQRLKSSEQLFEKYMANKIGFASGEPD